MDEPTEYEDVNGIRRGTRHKGKTKTMSCKIRDEDIVPINKGL